MCHFITLIAPTDDAEAVRAVMDRHGRAATMIDNPPLRMMLRDGERQYLTTRGHCDCGTVLAPRHDTPEAFEEKIAKEITRWKRKGWSETKIARAIEDQRKADARPKGSSGDDSLELWNAVLRDLGGELQLPYAGLFIRFYSGDVAADEFQATRRAVANDIPTQDALCAIAHDEVTVFQLN